MSDYDAAVTLTLQGVQPSAPEDPATAARFGMQQAVGSNGDLEAELQRVSAQTGVPISTVRAQPEEVKRQATMGSIDFDHLAAVAPSTAALLADMDKAKIVHDDVANLQGIEQSFRAAQAQGRAVRGQVGETFRRPGSLQQSGGQVGETFTRRGQLNPDEGSVVGGLFSADRFRSMSAGMSIAAADALGLDPSRAIRERNLFSARATAAGPQFQSLTAQAIYGGLESTISNLPGVAASLLTMNPAPALAWAGLQSGGEAYGKYRGRGATPGQATLGAAGEGAVEVGTELLPMGFLVNKFGKAGAGEFLTGLLAREMPGEQIATFVQDALDTAIANPSKTWGEFWRERPGAAYQTAVSTLVQSGVMAGAASATRNTFMRHQAAEYDAQQAEQNAALLGQVVQMAAASKVRERDAPTFEAFMQSATEDGPLEKVYINPAEAQKAGIDLTQLAQVAPSAAAQIQQALETGVDVAIPTAELTTRLPGTELEQSLLQHLKTDPGGFSQAGAQQYLQTQGETMRQEVEKQLAEHTADTAFKDSMRAVETNVMQQLHAANRFTDDVNGPYAAMWASFFGVQAARVGTTPQELFDRYAPRIVAHTPESAATLDQVAQQVAPAQAEAPAQPAVETPEAKALGQRHDILQKLLECLA